MKTTNDEKYNDPISYEVCSICEERKTEKEIVGDVCWECREKQKSENSK